VSLKRNNGKILVSLLETVEELVTTIQQKMHCRGYRYWAFPADTKLLMNHLTSWSLPTTLADIGLQVSPQTNEFQLTKLPQLETSSFTPNTNPQQWFFHPLRPPGKKVVSRN